VQQADKRVPIIAGTGSNNTEEAIDLTRHAESAGADAALVVTPYYNKPTQKGLYSHFEAISKSTKLPIIIYNIPGRSIVDMSTETMKSLFKIENIVGVKDATSNIPRVYESKTVIGENFNQLTGDDATTLAFMTYGGHGSISVTSNIAPKLCSQFMQLCLSKDFAEAAKINDKLMPLHHALFVESSPGPVKYAASKLGLCGEEIRLPLTLISDETKVLVDKALKHASLI
jgi:4-hydroxy-tetrahydrodipicolinate synthase